MRMNNRLKVLVLTVIIVAINSFGYTQAGNMGTSKPGVKELQSAAQQLIFYANIQRVVRGKPFMLLDPVLQKAAFYQASYCAKKNKLTKKSSEDGMTLVEDRIKHVGGISRR